MTVTVDSPPRPRNARRFGIGSWLLMNRAHFRYVTRLWYYTGLEANLNEPYVAELLEQANLDKETRRRTANVVALRPGLDVLSPDPESRRERARDAAVDAWLASTEPVRNWLSKSPIVVRRRSTITANEKNAFEIGRASILLQRR